MLVKTLDDFQYKWKMNTAAATKKSGPHLKVLEFLKELYPTVQILEEVQIEIKKNKTLYLDFYIPLYNIAIEINGIQHREIVPFFNKNQDGLVKQQINDNIKKLWCEFNNIAFISLNDNETREEWQKKFI